MPEVSLFSRHLTRPIVREIHRVNPNLTAEALRPVVKAMLGWDKNRLRRRDTDKALETVCYYLRHPDCIPDSKVACDVVTLMQCDLRRLAARLIPNVPVSELWRLFIDGGRQQSCPRPDLFENEAGYMNAMCTTFLRAMSTPHIDLLSQTGLRTLHAGCVTNVVLEQDREITGDRKVEFRDTTDPIGVLFNYDLTQAGLDEVAARFGYEKTADGSPRYWYEVSEGKYSDEAPRKVLLGEARADELNLARKAGKRVIMSLAAEPKQRISELVQDTLDQFRLAWPRAVTRREKLTALGDFIQRLEILHPFCDGNTRTHVMVLLNTLLAQNGFGLALHFRPTELAMLSSEARLEALEAAILRFSQYVAPSLADVSDKPHDAQKRIDDAMREETNALRKLTKLDCLYRQCSGHSTLESVRLGIASQYVAAVRSALGALDSTSIRLLGSYLTEPGSAETFARDVHRFSLLCAHDVLIALPRETQQALRREWIDHTARHS